MINSKEAKRKTYAVSCYDVYQNQIESAIIQSIANKLLHCDWYTPANYDCTDGDVSELGIIVDELKENGYKVRMYTFLPNENFNNVRVKLHINWE